MHVPVCWCSAPTTPMSASALHISFSDVTMFALCSANWNAGRLTLLGPITATRRSGGRVDGGPR